MAVKNELHTVVIFHRKQANLSRKQLAELAGVGKTVVYDIENGKQTVRWSTVLSILKALNINLQFQSPLMEEYAEGTNQDT